MRKYFKIINKPALRSLPFLLVLMLLIFVPENAHALWDINFSFKSLVLVPIMSAILGFMSLFTMLGGLLLNASIKYTILEMGKNLPNEAIVTAWSLMRDLANMSFIFILLYTSIMLIIGERSVKDARNLIVKMVIAAILINFSLFGTRLVIDASNLMALTLYKAIAPNAITVDATVLNSGISNTITNILGITTFFKADETLTEGSIITIGILGSIFLLIAAFVFLAAALLILIRFIVLVFVMIFSPLALMADILPGAKTHFNKWKDALINHGFFPSIFFLLMWVSLTVLETIKERLVVPTGEFAKMAGGVDSAGNPIPPTGDFMTLVVNFILVIGFLVASLVMAKSMASKAPGGVDKLVKSATGWAGTATFGGLGYAGRRTIGAYGSSVADSEELKKRASEGKGWSRMSARLQLKAGQKAAASSYDFRGSKAGGATLGQVDAGKAGGKGGYTQFVKDQTKARTEFEKSLAPSDIVVDQAKQNLEKAKNIDITTPEFKEEYTEAHLEKSREIREAEAKKVQAQKIYDDYVARVKSGKTRAHPETVKAYRDEINNADKSIIKLQKEKEAMRSKEGYKKQLVDKAQAVVDDYTGVDEKTAKKRREKLDDEEEVSINSNEVIKNEKRLEEAVNKMEKEIESISDPDEKKKREELLALEREELKLAKESANIERERINKEFKEKREAIKVTQGAGDIRKNASAAQMSNPSAISPDRVLFIGKVKKSSLQGAAELRKGKKDAKKLMEEVLKETGELPEKAKEEAGEGEPKPGSKEGESSTA